MEPKYNGQNRFEAGKGLAHRSMEIKNAAAKIARDFKAGKVVDLSDVQTIRTHIEEMYPMLEFWNDERHRELRDP